MHISVKMKQYSLFIHLCYAERETLIKKCTSYTNKLTEISIKEISRKILKKYVFITDNN